MYSSTVSTATTIPVDKNWCRSISSGDISTQKLEYFRPCVQFDDTLLRKLTKPIPLQKKEIEQKDVPTGIYCTKRLQEKEEYINKWSQQEFTNKCMEWNAIRLRLRRKSAQREECAKKFQKLTTPWYMTETQSSLKDRSWPNFYYCYPKICVKLDSKCTDYRKIIRYFDNGIKIFLVDLRYGTRAEHLSILGKIEYALKVLDEKRSIESIITVGLEINDRRLKTGLTKHSENIFLDRDSIVLLTANRKYSNRCTHKVVYVNFANYIRRMKADDIISLGDRIKLKVCKVWAESLECRVLYEGIITSKMAVKIPVERTLEELDLTKEEEEDILFAVNWRCDFIVCCYTLTPKLTHYIRWTMATKKRKLIILAKIYTNINYVQEDIELILREYSGIWLKGSEYSNLAMFKYLIDNCLYLNKPIIRFTTFKSEDIHIDNQEVKRNLLLYPDCIAVPATGGLDPTKINTAIRQNYPEMNEDTLQLCTKHFFKNRVSVEYLLIRYALNTCLVQNITCIIMCNNSGKSVANLAKNRPLVPVIASLCDVPTARSLMILRNVIPLTYYDPIQVSWELELKTRVDYCIGYAKNLGYLLEDKPFLLCYDSFRGVKFSDVFRVLYLE